MIDRLGQQLGNYQLIELLGRGNWASVYLGEHLHLHTRAAIKVLHGSFAQDEVAGFLGEARTLARLRHPHIVRVLDFGVQEGVPFLVLDYAPGGTLRQLHPKGTRLPLVTVVSYVLQVAQALQYAHDRQLIHRDVKPENLLLGHDQEILLSDFGLALFVQSSRDTQTRNSAGTIAYMAPEQIQAHPRPASDQYALGVVAYEWLCGERPFSGSPTEVAVKQTLASPPSLCEQVPTLPMSVEQVVFRALAKDPDERFASVLAFARSLEEASREDVSGRTAPALASAHLADNRGRTSAPGLPTGTVTLLFTDIEGSTFLLQQVGEQYAEVLATCRQLLRAAFQQWNGREVNMQGDSFFVAFARSTDAVAAAVAAQRALASHRWPEGVAVRVRISLHTGEPSRAAGGYVGLDVHHPARIMGVGHGGQVLLSQTTRELVKHDLPEGVGLQDLGEHRLKDLQQPSHLFQLVIADLPADFPPLKTLDASPNNLPVPPTPFIGREQQVAAIQQLLSREEVRLLTLTGPGGTGKTRLGLQVAAELSDHFPDGVYFVNLAPLSDPEFVVPTIAQTLDVKESAAQPWLNLLKAHLREKKLLLLLDNFEQVVGAAVYVADLLASCPQLKVIVTSRASLHVRGEQEFAVPPLVVPDPKHLPDVVALLQYEAVALFISRAQAVKPEFQVTHTNAPAVAEICVRLDGLPLAIELAAAHSKLLSPQNLLARLEHRLHVLTRGAQDAPIRQQTLRHTIAWSYNLLTAQEQRLFRRLSVFVGGCTLEAIEALCTALNDGAEAVLESMASLLDKSLLRQTEQEGEEPRLLMLETMREYGLEALATSGEMEAIQQAHADYYLKLAEEADPLLRGSQQLAWFERLDREHNNLRAAMQWALERGKARDGQPYIELALHLGFALQRFWMVRGHVSEGQDALRRGLAMSEGVAPLLRAQALDTAGMLAWLQDDADQIEVLCRESLTLYQELRNKQGMASSLFWLSSAARNRGELAQERMRLEEALALFKEVDDKENMAWSYKCLKDICTIQGEYTRAFALHEQAMALQREIGNTFALVGGPSSLAHILFLSGGDPATIRSLAEEGLARTREIGAPGPLAASHFRLAEAALAEGDAARARSLVEEGLQIVGVVIGGEISEREGTTWALIVLGKAAIMQGDYGVAQTVSMEGLRLGFKPYIPFCLEGVAEVATKQREPRWAAQLWGAAEALREAMGTPIPPVWRADYERSVAAARTQLGEHPFAAAWTEGRSMTPEQVLVARGPVTMPMPVPTTYPSSPPPAKSPSTYPDGLTAREVEVLRLVARGLTNAQIAQELIVSPHTVHAHVRSLHSKLDLSSRSALTRYAFEQHLA